MKTVIIIISLIFSMQIKSQSTVKTSTISVKGNCGECKERIENAADIKGVKNAKWDEKTHITTITYDTKKVSLDQIEKAIAKAGYETASQKADSSAYKALPQCCKYNDNKHSKN
jgi:copper chaperone CopZ